MLGRLLVSELLLLTLPCQSCCTCEAHADRPGTHSLYVLLKHHSGM